MSQPLGIDRLHRGCRAGVVTRERPDREFDGEPARIAAPGIKFDQLAQRESGVGRLRGLLADCGNASIGPLRKHGVDQGAAVGEMPVEAALGDGERLGDRLDPHGVDALRCQDVERRRDPGPGVERAGAGRGSLGQIVFPARHAALTPARANHTVPY